MDAMNLYLVGYRCTGKTTLGRSMAERLGWPLVDTDRVIVDTAGMSIDRMVAAYGWPFFRQRESEVLSRVSAENRQVVAGLIGPDPGFPRPHMTGRLSWPTARMPRA